MLADNDYPSMVEMNSENENSSKDKKHNSRTIFGSYQLLRTIGEGEFGKVKLGVKLNTQSAVCFIYIYIYLLNNKIWLILIYIIIKLNFEKKKIIKVAIKLIKKKSVYNQNKLTKLCQEISILEVIYLIFILIYYTLL